MFSWLPWSFWLFLMLPVIDVWLSISFYGLFGAEPIIGVFIGTWLLGGWIFSRQTVSVVTRTLVVFSKGEFPEDELQEAVGLVIAAALLATPGIVTDLMGFALLTPGLRLYLVHVIFDAVWGSIIFDFLAYRPTPDEDDDDPDPPRPDDIQRDLQLDAD